jgi:hypothetical protein
MVAAVFYCAKTGDFIRFRKEPYDILDILPVVALAFLTPSDSVWLIPGMEVEI